MTALIPIKETQTVLEPIEQPEAKQAELTGAPFKWEDIKDQIPEEFHNKTKDALSIASTYNLNPSEVYGLVENFQKQYGEKNLYDKAVGSFKAGIGDVYATMGQAGKWAGLPGMDMYIGFGENLRKAYIPPVYQPEFSYKSMTDPEWWATTVNRSVPSTLSLIPAALISAYGGTAAATAVGLGRFGQLVFAALGATAVSRPLESAMEAGAAREDSLAKGKSEEEADKAASTVFEKNLALAGIDVAQFALAFSPIKLPGKSAQATIIKRVLSGVTKLGGVAAMEGGEERYQELIQLQTIEGEGEFFANDPRLNEATAIGGIFGAGMGGGGTVWTSLKESITETMSPELKQQYENSKEASGLPNDEAELVALNELAETPEGEAHINEVMDYLKDPPQIESEIKIIGVEEDAEGNPISYTMMERDTGETFEIKAPATSQDIEIARAALREPVVIEPTVDEIIESDEVLETVAGETLQTFDEIEKQRARSQAERFRGGPASDLEIKATREVNQLLSDFIESAIELVEATTERQLTNEQKLEIKSWIDELALNTDEVLEALEGAGIQNLPRIFKRVVTGEATVEEIIESEGLKQTPFAEVLRRVKPLDAKKRREINQAWTKFALATDDAITGATKVVGKISHPLFSKKTIPFPKGYLEITDPEMGPDAFYNVVDSTLKVAEEKNLLSEEELVELDRLYNIFAYGTLEEQEAAGISEPIFPELTEVGKEKSFVKTLQSVIEKEFGDELSAYDIKILEILIPALKRAGHKGISFERKIQPMVSKDQQTLINNHPSALALKEKAVSEFMKEGQTDKASIVTKTKTVAELNSVLNTITERQLSKSKSYYTPHPLAWEATRIALELNTITELEGKEIKINFKDLLDEPLFTKQQPIAPISQEDAATILAKLNQEKGTQLVYQGTQNDLTGEPMYHVVTDTQAREVSPTGGSTFAIPEAFTYESVKKYYDAKAREYDPTYAKVVPTEKTLSEDIQTQVDQITKDWAKTINITAFNKLPFNLKNFIISQKAITDVQAVYDPATKEAYIISENIRQGDNIERILLHEIVGHYGFEQVIAEGNFDLQSIAGEIQRLKKSGNKKILATAEEVASLYEETLDSLIEAKEIIAHMAQTGVKNNLLRKIIVAFKKGLRFLTGGRFGKLSDLEILDLIVQAQDLVQGSKVITPSATNAKTTLASKKSPIWYSRLSKLVLDSQINKQKAPQWISTFNSWKKKKLPPALQEELEWSGLLDALVLRGKEVVTKSEILSMIREGGVKVEETLLSDKSQYASATLSGGVNYKELLVTLPHKEIERFYILVDENYITLPDFEQRFSSRYKAKKFAEKNNLRNYKIAARDDYRPDVFKPAHFTDVKNLLVHLRFDERIDTEGKKVLFVNEIQSDWAKEARTKGVYQRRSIIQERVAENTRLREENSRKYDEWLATIGITEREPFPLVRLNSVALIGRELTNEENLQLAEFARIHSELTHQLIPDKKKLKVPDAPFIKSDTAWSMLGLKRAIKYAVDHGFDKVAWPGEAQQIYNIEGWGEVEAERTSHTVEAKINGTWQDMAAYDSNFEERISNEEAEIYASELREEILNGKFDTGVSSDELIDLPPENYVRVVTITSPKGRYQAAGQDVTPIVNRYLKDLPRNANRFLKGQLGAKVKVEKTELGLGKDVRATPEEANEVYMQDGEVYINTEPFEAYLEREVFDDPALDVLDILRLAEKEGRNITIVEETQEINSIDLAPIKNKVSTEGVPLFSKKKVSKAAIRKATGQVKESKEVKERVALQAAFRKAAQNARIAYRAGKKDELAKQKVIMEETKLKLRGQAEAKIAKIKTSKDILARRRKSISYIQEYFGLSDNDLKKISRKDIRLMSNWEFKQFKDDLQLKAVELQEKQLAKATLINTIFEKRLEKVDNYRQILELPAISKMTTEQFVQFNNTLQEFQEGDVFLTKRELETVDRTDLKGIKTWRGARQRLAKETGVEIEDLQNIKMDKLDAFRWDTSLVERNPFYHLLVTDVLKSMMGAELETHNIETKVYDLAKKSEASRKLTVAEKAIPQDAQMMEYLEADSVDKQNLAKEMTAEQLDYAHYIQEYFGQALEYLISVKALEKGRENYFVHMRRTFLETLKEDGLLTAVKDIFKNYQQDQLVFGILDDATGNILPLEKFFQFSLQRTGELVPTKNITRAFMNYVSALEKKKALDAIIPKMDIYAQSLTPKKYTPRGLEIDRSLKQFVNRYINNKKGRRTSFDGIIKQGGEIDLGIAALRTFTTMMDLGLNIPVGLAAIVGEQTATFAMLGPKAQAKGTKRIFTEKGKRILKKYESFVGRSLWEEFAAPGKEVTRRLAYGLFGLFHLSSVNSNKQFLLGSMTEEEWKNEQLSTKRLAELKLEMGRMRKVPGSESLVGSTSLGKAAVQYKSWAVPIIRTLSKDISTIVKDLKAKPPGEALSSKEAKEIYRAISLTSAVLIVGAMGTMDGDDSFVGTIKAKVYREATTLMQGMDPKLWLSVPRILTFMAKLGTNITSLLKLEEYKSEPGTLKGPRKLKQQFTPRFFKIGGQSKGKRVQPLNP